MNVKDIQINRDTENDIIYAIKKGINRETTVNFALTPDIVVRLDPATKEVVGVTIEDFSSLYPHIAEIQDEWVLMERIECILEFLNNPDFITA